jgi:hypothetical protein
MVQLTYSAIVLEVLRETQRSGVAFSRALAMQRIEVGVWRWLDARA